MSRSGLAVLVICLLLGSIVPGCSRSDPPSPAPPGTDSGAEVDRQGDDPKAAAPPQDADAMPGPGQPAGRQTEPSDEASAEEQAVDQPTAETGASLGDPQPGDPQPGDPQPGDPQPGDGEQYLEEAGYVSPSDVVQQQLQPPPGMVQISQMSPLWIDPEQKRVFVDGYVAQQEAYLEMFACPAETKEHESVVAVIARSSELHAALLAVGAQPGKPVQFAPEYVPASGQRIRVWVMWYDEDGQFQAIDGRRWVRRCDSDDSLDRDWVFGGSHVWQDPEDNREYYQADSGEMICVSNFTSAMMDVPIESSDAEAELLFEAYTERIPERGTPLRLVLQPLPPLDPEADQPLDPKVDPPDWLSASLMPRADGSVD